MLDTIPSPHELFDVSGKVAIITGATGGLGKAASLGLAKAGAKVVLTGRNADTLAPITQAITAAGLTATHIASDPLSHDDNKRIVAHAVETYGGLDIVLTAAGMNKPAPIVEQPVEEWEHIMDVNVKGTYLMCKEAGKVLIQQGRGGKVILVSSQRGKLGLPNYSAYCPSKGAIDSLTQTLAWEWGPHHINVNAIAPTVFRTALTQWIYDSPEVTKRFLARIPIGRLGEPEDFIGAVLFLSSCASDMMTGAILYVDGGYTAG
jgi:NAD(P)-dependent dehydrogenase (short-subunit alcohol dehydrogenase family)